MITSQALSQEQDTFLLKTPTLGHPNFPQGPLTLVSAQVRPFAVYEKHDWLC